jgi:hypothetical protein
MSGHKFIVEHLQVFEHLSHFLGRVDQVCNSEVIRAFDLAEAASRHRHYPCLIHHLETILKVGLDSSL